MDSSATYVRYYFPDGLRWTITILLLPLVVYLLYVNWYITSIISIVIVMMMWSFKYVTSIDPHKKIIRDHYYRFWIPIGEHYPYNELNKLIVSKEQKGYKAASRSRDYWVKYTEYTLYLKY